jgi:hypothetical protein
MDWLLHSNQLTVLWVVLLLASLALLVGLRRRGARSLPSSRNRTAANSIGNSAESGCDAWSSFAPSANDAVAGNPSEASQSLSEEAPERRQAPEPSSIVADVCSLQSPVRERVAQSYRGMRVKWALRLAAISEAEQAGEIHSVRMYPDARSPFSCGVYFGVNLEEHPGLQAAHKDELFVVEGTVENVDGTDIDLKDVQAIAKAA